LVVRASPEAVTTTVVIVSSSKFLRVLAARWLGVFRQSCGCSDIGLLVEEQVVSRKYGSFICRWKSLVLEQRLPIFHPRKRGECTNKKQLPVALVM
jgi:hypothetical protein